MVSSLRRPANAVSNFEGELQSSVYLSLQKAERKHGRVCMLASLIFICETGFGKQKIRKSYFPL